MSRGNDRPITVVMLLENDLYPHDVRVRYEALSLVRNGYAVRVVAPRGPGQPRHERIEGVEVERCWLPMEHSGRPHELAAEYVVAHCQLWARGIRAVLRGADVLHVHNPPDTLFVPQLVGARRGCRLVFDQHDLFPALVEERLGSGPLLAVARAAQRATVRLADLTLATNKSHAEAAIDAGADPDRVVVVRNAIDRAAYAQARPLRPGALDDPHLVYVGALGPQDGVRALAEVLRGVVVDQGLDGTRLTVVGYGEEREPLERRLDELGLADRVSFTGRVTHDRVLEIVSDADICVDTAECTEFNHRTTMVKIVEYLSLGRPTVAFALRETGRTAGDAAVLVDCGGLDGFVTAVAGLARSGARREELGARARLRAEDLTWERSEAALLDGYRRMLR